MFMLALPMVPQLGLVPPPPLLVLLVLLVLLPPEAPHPTQLLVRPEVFRRLKWSESETERVDRDAMV